jgi:hypothetical protein
MRNKILFAQKIFLNIFCTEFYTNLVKKKLKMRSKILFAQKNFLNIFCTEFYKKSDFNIFFKKCLAKLYLRHYVKCFPFYHFSQDSEILIGFVGTPVPNFIKIGQ